MDRAAGTSLRADRSGGGATAKLVRNMQRIRGGKVSKGDQDVGGLEHGHRWGRIPVER